MENFKKYILDLNNKNEFSEVSLFWKKEYKNFEFENKFDFIP